MNIRLSCIRCKTSTNFQNMNPARMGFPCPVCGEPNALGEAVQRRYGDYAGRETFKILKALDRMGDKRNVDLRQAVEYAGERIEAAIAVEAR